MTIEKDIASEEESLDEESTLTDEQDTVDNQDMLYEKDVDLEKDENILDEDDAELEDDTPEEDKYIPDDSKSVNRSAPALNSDSVSTKKTGNAVKEAVNRLNDKERRYGFIASIVAAILWLLLTVPLLIHPAKPHKGQLGTDGIAIYLAVGLLLAGIIFFASWIKRRALLGFAVLFTGFSFGGDLLFAIPFYALGAWLIWQAMKVQRELQTTMQAAGVTRTKPTKTRDPLFSRMTRRGERQQAKATVARATPAASKRYTPPRSATKTSRRHSK